MKLSRRIILFAALAAAVALAVAGLQPRLCAEKNNKTVAFVIDYRDILSLSYQSGQTPDAVLAKLKTLGVAGVCVDAYRQVAPKTLAARLDVDHHRREGAGDRSRGNHDGAEQLECLRAPDGGNAGHVPQDPLARVQVDGAEQ